jgi:hypothetical protein
LKKADSIFYLFPVLLDHNYAAPAITAPDDFLRQSTCAAVDLVARSLATSSRPRYDMGWRRWTDFCQKAKVRPFPAASEHVLSGLAHVVKETQTLSTVEAVYASISHFHRSRGLPPPTANPAIDLLMRSVRRDLGRPTRSVKPLTLEIVQQMIDHLSQQEKGTQGYVAYMKYSWTEKIFWHVPKLHSHPNSCKDQ